jgi:phage terminase large subunit
MPGPLLSRIPVRAPRPAPGPPPKAAPGPVRTVVSGAAVAEKLKELVVQIDITRKTLPLLTPKRWKVMRGGRGGTKSWVVVNVLLAMARKSRLRIVCGREVQKSIRASVYTLFLDRMRAYGWEDEWEILETSLTHKRTGTEITFTGLRDHTTDSIKSLEGCDIFWIEEAQSVSIRSLDLLIPTIRKPGSEIWATYNPTLDSDAIHMHVAKLQKYQPELLCLMEVSLDDNPWAPQDLLAARDLDYLTDPIKAGQIWGGQTKQIVEGAIYERELSQAATEHRITAACRHDPSAKTVLAFDLGRNDCTSIIIGQYVGRERRIFWSYENRFQFFPFYIDEIKRTGFRIDHIILPHDGRTKTISTLESPESMCKKAWPNATVEVLQATGIELGIEHARQGFNQVWIHPELAQSIYSSLKRYRRALTGHLTPDGKPLYGDPVHDDASHGGDCFRYWMQYKEVPMLSQADTNAYRAYNYANVSPFQ